MADVLYLLVTIIVVVGATAFWINNIGRRKRAESDLRLEMRLLEEQARMQKKNQTQPDAAVAVAAPIPPVPSAPAPMVRVGKDGQDLGELSAVTVAEMLRDGRLTRADFFLDVATNSWKALADHSEIGRP
jgi:hypothetical protein